MKYQSWHFYLLLHDDAKKGTETINKLTEACDSMTGRKPGGKNEPLKMERPTPKKVEITWPTPVSHDSCTRVLTKALGQNWKVYVSAPSGAGTRTQVPAATAETADEAESLEDIVGEAIEAAASAAAGARARWLRRVGEEKIALRRLLIGGGVALAGGATHTALLAHGLGPRSVPAVRLHRLGRLQRLVHVAQRTPEHEPLIERLLEPLLLPF